MKASFFAKFLTATIATALMAGPAFAAAQSTPVPANPVTLKGDVKLEKSITENGATSMQLLDPTVVVPGDRLLFTTRYHNEGAQPVTNFVVTNPLPPAVVLSSDTAAETEVSVDGGKTWGLLSTLKVSDGQSGMRAALGSDVTHLRWTIAKIAAGANGRVEYHAIVR